MFLTIMATAINILLIVGIFWPDPFPQRKADKDKNPAPIFKKGD